MKTCFALLWLVPIHIATIVAPERFSIQLAQAAEQLTKYPVSYHPTYEKIKYPMGDVAPNKGVCTDVVIRAYRYVGIDLQKEVHEDMRHYFSKYPKQWGLKTTDTNIDHRRVPNLMTFFSRYGQVKPTNKTDANYQPGDIVCWQLPKGLTHIGIVANKYVSGTNRPMIVHNIGAGQVMEDALFSFPIIGHYSYKK